MARTSGARETAIGKINPRVGQQTNDAIGTRVPLSPRASPPPGPCQDLPIAHLQSFFAITVRDLHHHRHNPSITYTHPQSCRNPKAITTLASRLPTKTPSRTPTAVSSTPAVTAMPKSHSSAATPSVARSAVTVSCTSSAPTGMIQFTIESLLSF